PRRALRGVVGDLELLKALLEIELAIEPARLLGLLEVARARVDRQAREDVLVRLRLREEVERLAERLLGLAAVAEHHVVAQLDAPLLGELGRLEDVVDGDLLVDLLEDLRRARLDAERQARAAGEAHLVEELVGEEVDARVAAPHELQPALADPAAQLD